MSSKIQFVIAPVIVFVGLFTSYAFMQYKSKQIIADRVITIHDGTYKFIYNQCMYEGSIYEGNVTIKGITSK